MILQNRKLNQAKSRTRRRSLAFSLALAGGMLIPAFVNAGTSENSLFVDYSSRLTQLEIQTDALGQSLGDLSGSMQNLGFSSSQTEPRHRTFLAQARDNASMNLRISQVEEQLRSLTGQVEGLQFQMTQLQTLLERMQEDNEFRFQQLEGGGPGKTEAAIQSGGDRPTVELPQTQNQTQNQNQGQTVLSGVEHPTELIATDDTIEDGDDFEPNEGIVLGAESQGEFRLPDNLLSDGQTMELDFDPGSLVTDQDAEAQYKAGFEAIMEGNYDFAQTQFYQFIALYPDHEQAPDATNLLGEALLQNGNFDEAAQVLFAGFELYQNTPRGANLLFGLGKALAGAGEHETACRTFDEVLRRYPGMGNAFELSVALELSATQC